MPPRKRRTRGHIEQLPSGSFRAIVYGGIDPLTGRERELLTYALDGSPVAAIAARVHLSEGTVRNHLSAAIGKTGATTRSEAARIAQDRGWL